MEQFSTQIQVRWSDLDPNFHLRHSVYYDWAALSRISFLDSHGLNADTMQRLKFGPILFREEAIFRREIRLGDPVTINLELVKARKDYSRWTIRHTVMKNPATVSAIITVDGAWLNMIERKLAVPPDEVSHVFRAMPMGEGFQWEEKL